MLRPCPTKDPLRTVAIRETQRSRYSFAPLTSTRELDGAPALPEAGACEATGSAAACPGRRSSAALRVEEKEAGPTTRRTRYHATRSSFRTLRRRSYFRVAPQRLLKSNAADYQRQSLCRSYRAHAATTKPSSAFAEGAAQRSASQWCYTREHGATVKMRQAGAKRRATSSQPRIPPSPPVGQQDTGNVVSGRKSEPTTTTNKSAAATTMPRPLLESQWETAIIPGYQHQWTTVDQPLLVATSSLSPHNEQ
ncbi:hypothetical protein HPB51_024274 [Rhipicephalus microplus]|uniref:Uncharacterized protein n=1 Tax=Rhipicephalus microplus TaxID=6941 RepID=A0A9J6E573_RHIMP|nr:hypothetical protein HPB51_024274 [Rhipicephalus microplus]